MSIFGQILFIVRKQDERLVFEKISPISEDESRMDFENTFTEQAKSEIASRCNLVLSGEDDTGSFSTSLNGASYMITLINQLENVFIFLAAEEPSDSTECVPDNSAFFKLCNGAENGIFIWRVKKHEFFLSFANTSYFLQTGLPDKAIHKMPEDIFSPNKASLLRSRLVKCANLMKTISYKSKSDNKIFGITLYPQIKDGQVVRIMGVSTDITKHVSAINQPKQNNMHFSQCEKMLQIHIQFEEILSRSAREFLDSGLSGFNDCIERLVENLGLLFDADWAFAGKSDTALCGKSSQWFARLENGQDRLRGIMENPGFGVWSKQLRAGRIFVANDIHKELPSLSCALKDVGSPEVRSFIAVPVFRSDEFWGVLSVSSFRQKRIWTTREISVLKTAADMIMSAYLRTKMEKQLIESNRVLVEYDECLQDMLSVQEMLNVVSRQFLTAEPKDFANCASDMLKALSELTDVDQACISVIGHTPFQFYSWHKKGLAFQACEQDKLNSIESGWSDFLDSAEQIAVEDVSQEICSLPMFIQDYILSTGLKSLLIIPIRSGDKIIAVLFLAKVLGSCRWDNSMIHTAKQFTDVFLDAFIKMQRQQQQLLEIKYDAAIAKETLAQAALIKKIAECAQQLIDANAENLPSIYRSICKAISQHLPIDSINLTQYSQDYTKTFIVFNWHATGPLPRCTSSLSIHDESMVLSIPVFYNEIVWGCLLVNLTAQSPAEGFIRALEMVAESFVRAYMRIHPDKKDCIESARHTAISLSPRPLAIV